MKVLYYISTRGKNPVMGFIDSHLSSKPKVMHILWTIEAYGLQAALPHLKKLSGTPLWEIRILGQNSVRIFYVSRGPEGILLLHAFEKKTQKTPSREIFLAIKRLQELGIDR